MRIIPSRLTINPYLRLWGIKTKYSWTFVLNSYKLAGPLGLVVHIPKLL